MTWIKTYSGKHIDYSNPSADSICITDIAHHLSLENRFCGQSSVAYSVAAHSLLCLDIARKRGYSPYLQLRVLMHDFHEAYVKDVPTPLKKLLPNFRRLEAQFETLIENRYCLSKLTKAELAEIKHVDLVALKMEREALLTDDSDWEQLRGIRSVDGVTVPMLTPKTAEVMLLQAFGECWRAAYPQNDTNLQGFNYAVQLAAA
ncbi:hypothetical protein ACWA5Z_06495 [Testudinibacter sp. P80/BLE/0925]